MPKQELTEQAREHLGDPSFPFATVIYRFNPEYPASQHFFVAEVTGWSDDGAVYQICGAVSSQEDTPDPSKADRYFEGFVKWDGCSHVTFGDDNGYLHLCGGHNFTQLAEALTHIYKRCGQLMRDRQVYLLDGEFPV